MCRGVQSTGGGLQGVTLAAIHAKLIKQRGNNYEYM